MSRDDPFGLSEDRERTRIRLVGQPMPRAPMPAATRARRSSAIACIPTRWSTHSRRCSNSRPNSKARCRPTIPRPCAPDCSTNWCAPVIRRWQQGRRWRAPTRRPGLSRRCWTIWRSTRPGAAQAPGPGSRWSSCCGATSMPEHNSSPGWRRWSAIPTATANCWSCSITAWRSASAANIALPLGPVIAPSMQSAWQRRASCATPMPRVRRSRRTGAACWHRTSRNGSSCRSG